jgi:ABC-type nickel/cobalt efflux system permease component RcnA
VTKRAIHLALAASTICGALSAHPMGNFSVNHYSRLTFRSGGMELTYVLDLAEIPTFQLMGDWNAAAVNQPFDWKDQAALSGRSARQAQDWLDDVWVMQAGRRVPLRIRSVSPTAVEGAGGMPVLRTSIVAEAKLQPGEITYEDRNFPGRAGWKEIVVDHDSSVVLRESSQGSTDLSNALTQYPTDPGITQPQDLTARVNWSAIAAPVISQVPPAKPQAPVSTPVEAAAPAPFSQQQPEAPGTVVRGDFLSRMLQQKKLPAGVILIGILVAFGLGSLHAMSPGHGKTIVAAYLVGSRGTLKHAGLLGFVVTFTHTFTVFLLGLGMLFFEQYVVPEKIMPVLGAISGLSIVSVGLMLLYRRAKGLMGLDHGHSHAHPHGGEFHTHDHDHDHEPVRPTRSRIAELRGTELEHTHGGTTHSHVIEGEITPGSLIALGISGGMVPCPSALILMLSAIALGHPGVGLVLLVGFSTGLALVLMAFGMAAIYAKNLLPKSEGAMRSPLFRMIPVFSAVAVIVLGLAMTAVSAGWIRPLRFLS